MKVRRIRLFAAFLTVSFVLLMASASEVKAIDRDSALCASGRCIKATGYIGGYDSCGGGRYFGPAIFMLDLVAHYVGVDHESWHGFHFVAEPVNIHYYGFWIEADWIGSYEGMNIDIRVGLPGGARLHYGNPCDEFYFYGFASFYNRMEYVPWW